jgi:hypothetical protein
MNWSMTNSMIFYLDVIKMLSIDEGSRPDDKIQSLRFPDSAN